MADQNLVPAPVKHLHRTQRKAASWKPETKRENAGNAHF